MAFDPTDPTDPTAGAGFPTDLIAPLPTPVPLLGPGPMPPSVTQDPKYKLALLAALGAALGGGPRSGFGGVLAGLSHGALTQDQMNLQRYQMQESERQRQQQEAERQQQQEQQRELQRQRIVQSTLEDIGKTVPTLKKQDQYDQYITAQAAALQGLVGSRLNPQRLRQLHPFVTPDENQTLKDAVDNWLKFNGKAFEKDPTLADKSFLDVAVDGTKTPTRINVGVAMRRVGYQPLQGPNGEALMVEQPATMTGSPASVLMKKGVEDFTQRYHRQPTYDELKGIVKEAAQAVPPRQSASGMGGEMSDAGAGALTKEGVEFAGTLFRVTGKMPALGMGGKAERTAVVNEAARQAQVLKQTPVVAIQKQAAFSADSKSLDLMRKLGSSASAAENKALSQADLIAQLSPKVPRSQSPLLNRAIITGQIELAGNSDAQLLANAIQTFTNEYGKIIEGSTGSVAGASESARRAAEKLISARFNPKMLQDAIELMKKEMRYTVQGYDATIQDITERMTGGGPQTGIAPKNDPRASYKQKLGIK